MAINYLTLRVFHLRNVERTYWLHLRDVSHPWVSELVIDELPVPIWDFVIGTYNRAWLWLNYVLSFRYRYILYA